MIKRFKQSTIEKIWFYVYVLINPFTNKIFYIWKGKWNRIFSHLYWALKWDKESSKLNTIKSILSKNKIPEHKIIRHWLTEKEAFEVESALIDFYWIENLTNLVSGHNSFDRWIMSVNDIIVNYESEKIKIKDNLLLININGLFYYWMNYKEIYEATRKSWRLNINKVKNIKYVLSIYKWIVREVFEVSEWKYSKIVNWYKRYKFIWKKANEKIRNLYINKDVSDYFKQWSQNPIKYIYSE